MGSRSFFVFGQWSQYSVCDETPRGWRLYFRFYAIFWFTRSFHSICPIISLGKRAFSVIGPRLWNSLPPDTRNSSSLPIFCSRLKTHLQNCVPSLGSLPSPLTVYPDFDSCYSHFMPYQMTPCVRHKAIGVHYYYYYYYIFSWSNWNFV